MTIKVGILTVSDLGAQGKREDQSGQVIREMITKELDAEVAHYDIVPDERDIIQTMLVEWSDVLNLELILTTGGTGFGPRDVTPEATRAVIQREASGFVEAMRSHGLKSTPHAMLSRALAGIRGGTLIVNLPGSPKAVREGLEVILPALPHAIEILRGKEEAPRHHEYEP
jgi:molybdopterin adenylyltransferase